MLATLNDVLPRARENRYAVGLFNTIDTDMLEAVVSAAEALDAPVIIGTAEVLLPYGELSLIAPSVLAAADRARVPVVVHYDHGLTFERCLEALKLGFTSIMFDASTAPYEENVERTREMVRIAHAFGATVEGEIGHVGEAAAGTPQDGCTTAEEAAAFAAATGADALAVAIGTAHGVYKSRPHLDIGRLKEIRAAVDRPLVLHGGSGLSDADFTDTVAAGIAKINIFTDLCLAGDAAMKACADKNLGYLQTRAARVEAIGLAVEKKIRLFGSAGKAR